MNESLKEEWQIYCEKMGKDSISFLEMKDLKFIFEIRDTSNSNHDNNQLSEKILHSTLKKQINKEDNDSILLIDKIIKKLESKINELKTNDVSIYKELYESIKNVIVDKTHEKTFYNKIIGYRVDINRSTRINNENYKEYYKKELKDHETNPSKIYPNMGFSLDPETFKHLYHWLGFGLSFFLNNENLAYKYANLAIRREKSKLKWIKNAPIVFFKIEPKLEYWIDLQRGNLIFFNYLATFLREIIKKSKLEKDFKKLMAKVRILKGKQYVSWENSHKIDCVLIRFLEWYSYKEWNLIIDAVIGTLHEKYIDEYFKKLTHFKHIIKDKRYASCFGKSFPYIELKLTPEFLFYKGDLK
ncbi:MAG: hypothetical protein ACTSYS_11140, partial [Promethearchaeota archaeon]